MGDSIYSPVMQVFDSDGNPGVGYKLYTYESGTTTPKVVYTDEACTVPAANPVVFDSRGEATIYYADEYKFVLKTDEDVTVWTVDGVGTAATSSSSTTYSYYPDPDETDQGVTASGTGDTIYDIITEVGTSEVANIVLRHDGSANTTDYTLDTNIDLTSYPLVFIEIQPGARLVRTTGDELLTVDTPNNIVASKNQQITAVSMIRFNGSGSVPVEWFGSGTSATQFAVSSLLGGGTVELNNGTYTSVKVTITTDITLLIKQAATLKLADSTDDSLVYVNGANRFDLIGTGIIDGNKDNNSTSNGTIEVNATDIVNIGYVTIKDSDGDAVKITTATNGTITPIITDADGSGVYTVDCDNLDIRPDIDTCEHNGVIVVPSTKNCSNIRVGGYIKSPAQTGTPYVGVYFNSGDTYYVENSFISSIVEDAGYIGIYPGGDFNTITDGARVNGAGKVTSASGYGIWVHDSAHITIGSVVVSNGENTGILVNKAHNVTITGALSYRNANAGFWFDYDTNATGRHQTTDTNKATTCVGCMAIENSYGSVGTWPGFYIDGYRNLTLSGCQAHDYQGTQSQGRGVVAATNATTANISIIGCDFSDNVSGNGINVARGYLSQCFGNTPNDGTFITLDDDDWDDQPVIIGSYYLWVDSTGDLRIKSSAPSSDTDGTIVGTQS